ncbi:MAG: helix-turn-helix transcriptional regulator [Deltaproteobacteria bacterium]|nr:helix-turn-helix transcriptional regulator [Deltaproteobacteria bacterium]
MIRIDGAKVRQLREDRGLTQLYMATAVEVTTDTISRWENRRYPTIRSPRIPSHAGRTDAIRPLSVRMVCGWQQPLRLNWRKSWENRTQLQTPLKIHLPSWLHISVFH